ncbi:hypothetical protein QEN19_001919 [Hanseniaspora menglaensis]
MINLNNNNSELTTTPFHKHTYEHVDGNAETGNGFETPLDKINKSILSISQNVSDNKNVFNQSNSFLLKRKQRQKTSVLESNYKSNEFMNMRDNIEGLWTEKTRGSIFGNLINNRKLSDNIDELCYTRHKKSTVKRTIRNKILDNSTQISSFSPSSSSNNFILANNTFQKKPCFSKKLKNFSSPETANSPIMFWNKYGNDSTSTSLMLETDHRNQKDYSGIFVSKIGSKSLLSMKRKKKQSYKMEESFHKVLHTKHQTSERNRVDENHMCCDNTDAGKHVKRSPKKPSSISKGLKLFQNRELEVIKDRARAHHADIPESDSGGIDEEAKELMKNVVKDANFKIASQNGPSVVDIYLKETINLLYNIH